MQNQSTPASTNAPAEAPVRSKRKAPVVFGALIALAVCTGGIYVLLTWGTESTDNAQVEGHVLQIAARLPGQIEAVLAEENQQVKAGDLLVQLDAKELKARVEAAKGDQEAAEAAVLAASSGLVLAESNASTGLQEAEGGLEQAESGLSSSRASVDQAKADRDGAEARLHLAAAEYARTVELYRQKVVTKSDLDTHQSAYTQAKAQLAQAHAHLQNMEASIRGSSGSITVAKGRLDAAKTGPQQVALASAAVAQAKARLTQAKAALTLAELNLSYADVRAPFDGIITKRSAEPGQLVGPDRALFAIVAANELWVVANFKEDQIAHMQPGQPVSVTVDAFGRQVFKGQVESLATATGARFSLLPPDNSSGNFIKVTQRIPVRIRLIGAGSAGLRVGMSAEVQVDTAGKPLLGEAQASALQPAK